MASVELPQKIFDYPGRAKSEVWMHFGFYKVDNDLDTTKAVCRHCRRIYTNKGKKQWLLGNMMMGIQGSFRECALPLIGWAYTQNDLWESES